MSAMSEALAEAYACAPVQQTIFDTLEVRHPAFIDDSGNPTAIRVVIGYEDVYARIEDDAPMNAGAVVRFIAGAFRFSLPGFEEGSVPSMRITLDNVSREVTAHLEQAIEQLARIEVTYRPYLASDLSGPQMDPPVTMTLTNVHVDVFQVTGTATLSDVHNWPFPKRKYTPTDFPGLVR